MNKMSATLIDIVRIFQVFRPHHLLWFIVNN
jgi:hypothetical protein